MPCYVLLLHVCMEATAHNVATAIIPLAPTQGAGHVGGRPVTRHVPPLFSKGLPLGLYLSKAELINSSPHWLSDPTIIMDGTTATHFSFSFRCTEFRSTAALIPVHLARYLSKS